MRRLTTPETGSSGSQYIQVSSSEVAMTSIMTNAGAISAVDQLRTIMSLRSEAQQQINTGLRISAASDNTAYWSIATTMRSDKSALSATEDSLGMGAAVVDTAYSGMKNAIYLVDEIKTKLIYAREGGVSREKLNAEIDALREQLRTVVDSSEFYGENWLLRRDASDDADKQVIGSFNRDTQNNVSLTMLTYSMDNALGTKHLIDEDSQGGILTNADYAAELGFATDWVIINGSNAPDAHTEFHLDRNTTFEQVDEMIQVTERMLQAMTDAAAGLGSLMSRIELQKGFVVDLQDTQTRGVGRLVDADLDAASVRLRAVAAQRDLATLALSIANDSQMAMLKLLD